MWNSLWFRVGQNKYLWDKSVKRLATSAVEEALNSCPNMTTASDYWAGLETHKPPANKCIALTPFTLLFWAIKSHFQIEILRNNSDSYHLLSITRQSFGEAFYMHCLFKSSCKPLCVTIVIPFSRWGMSLRLGELTCLSCTSRVEEPRFKPRCNSKVLAFNLSIY